MPQRRWLAPIIGALPLTGLASNQLHLVSANPIAQRFSHYLIKLILRVLFPGKRNLYEYRANQINFPRFSIKNCLEIVFSIFLKF